MAPKSKPKPKAKGRPKGKPKPRAKGRAGPGPHLFHAAERLQDLQQAVLGLSEVARRMEGEVRRLSVAIDRESLTDREHAREVQPDRGAAAALGRAGGRANRADSPSGPRRSAAACMT